MTKDNHHLGTFALQVPPAPAKVPQIEVVFDVDSNGVLQVIATNKAANMSKDMTIIGDKGRLSKDEISKMQNDAELYKD